MVRRGRIGHVMDPRPGGSANRCSTATGRSTPPASPAVNARACQYRLVSSGRGFGDAQPRRVVSSDDSPEPAGGTG
jgi:hypothetical protein